MIDGIYTVCDECGAVVADSEKHTAWHTTPTEGDIDGE